MPSRADELRARVRIFAVRALKLIKTLSRGPASDAIARQLARSAPSISSNYHSTRRARSRREFIARMAVVADEAEETEGWLELLKQADEASGPELDWLINESRELRAIFVQSVKTARLNYQRSRGPDAVDP